MPCSSLRVPDHDDCGVLDSHAEARPRGAAAVGRRVIGVSGSAGKTTTKEAIAQVLDAKFNVLKSLGNLNNHFGVPLQLLRLEPEHEVAVIEMGMNHAGEIAALRTHRRARLGGRHQRCAGAPGALCGRNRGHRAREV